MRSFCETCDAKICSISQVRGMAWGEPYVKHSTVATFCMVPKQTVSRTTIHAYDSPTHQPHASMSVSTLSKSFTGLIAWWRHQMETFSALLALCAGNSPVPGEFPTQRPVTRSFDVFFDLHLNKRLSKQWWGWWFDTPSHPLWRHCNRMWNRWRT